VTPSAAGLEQFVSPRSIEGYLRRIATNRLRAGSYDMTVEQGVEFDEIMRHAASFARALSRAALERSHVFTPGAVRVRSVRGKEREFTSFGLSDLVLHYAAAAMVTLAFERASSRFVYSYVPGRSYDRAVAALAAYVQHRAKAETPEDLYVLRLDVAGYFESIPVHREATIWASLRRGLSQAHGDLGVDWGMWLLEQTIRPTLRLPDGGTCCRTLGLPIGTPLSPPVSNHYLLPLDMFLERHPGAFFARYGDDVIYCHKDPERVLDVERETLRRLGDLGLSVSEQKSARLRLTASGAAAGHPAFEPTQFVNFLGLAVGPTGRLRLQEAHVAKLLRELRRRVSSVVACFVDETIPERVLALRSTLRQALDLRSPFRAKHTRPFATVRIDRAQRRYIEHELALLVARGATGIFGVRALRRLRASMGPETHAPALLPSPVRVSRHA
jgi:hypothetical protein